MSLLARVDSMSPIRPICPIRPIRLICSFRRSPQTQRLPTVTHPRDELPTSRQWLIDGFDWFVRGYFRKHFHAVAINRDGLKDTVLQQPCALVVYANHCSWWDPLIAMLVKKCIFPDFKLYAPIDQDSLEKYRIFRELGFYGVKHGTTAGAANFLRKSLAILRTPGSSIWITPEGHFCDVRNRSLRLMPGIGHLAHCVQSSKRDATQTHKVYFIPIAIELPFWEERLPECLVWFGSPIELDFGRPMPTDKVQLSELFESALRSTQDELAAASIARDSQRFEVLLHGRGGSWGVYDAFRRFGGWLRGKPVELNHSDKLSGT